MHQFQLALAAILGSLFISVCVHGPAFGQINVQSIDPPAIQYGGPNELVIQGANLNRVEAVVFSCKSKYEILSKSLNGKKMVLSVEVLDKSEAGINTIRFIGSGDVTPFLPIGVDAIPNSVIPPDQPTRVDFSKGPIAVHGKLSGQQKAMIEFEGKRGTSFLCGVESNRLGSKMKPEFHLLDSRGRQLAWSQPNRILGGDTRFRFKIPADGTYTIEFRDQLYRAPANSQFRIKLGEFAVADQALAVQNNLAEATNLTTPSDLEQVAIPGPGLPLQPLPFANEKPFSGWRPAIQLLGGAEIFEKEKRHSTASTQHYPVAINGRISETGEVDEYPLGSSNRLDVSVRASQLGSPLDAVVTILDKNGKVLGQSDDSPQSIDPRIQVNVPKGTQGLRVRIKDLLGRGGKPFIYRIEIGNHSNGPYQLSVDRDHVFAYPGSHSLIRVEVDRRGQSGPIELSLAVPDSVDYFPKTIPAGKNSTFVVLTPDKKLAASAWQLVSSHLKNGYATQALVKTRLAENVPSWMKSQMTISTSKPPMVSLTAGKPKRLLFYPMIQKVELAIQRQPENKSRLRVSMETTQLVKQLKQGNKTIPAPGTTIRPLNKVLDLEAGASTKSLLIFVPPSEAENVNFVFAVQAFKLKVTDPKKPFEGDRIYSNAQSFARPGARISPRPPAN